MARLICSLDIFAFLTLVIVLLGIYRAYRIEEEPRRPLMLCIMVELLILLVNALYWLLIFVGVTNQILLGITALIYYLGYHTLLVFFAYFVADYISERTKVSPWYARVTIPLAVFYSGFWAVTYFSGLLVRSDVVLGRVRGPYYFLGALGSFLIMGDVICIIWYYHRSLQRYEILSLLSFLAFPLVTSILALFIDGISLVQIAFALSLLLIQSFLIHNRILIHQKQKEEILQDKMQIMLSQIRPHFIYNVLNTIYYLCDDDSKKAKEAISTFSRYLRKNFSSLEKSEMIPISEELEHVGLYVSLEQMRFGDELRIRTQIDPVDFQLPPLTIEALVENAIKHGLTKREGIGSLYLEVRDEKERVVITVKDDGVGFDTEKLEREKGEHIGINNIRERVEIVCKGELTIESEPGAGTTAVITIPLTRPEE